MKASQLPIDVIHEILESAPDFATLATAIRISKKHHEVFEAHPKSIMRAVAENVVGPALLQAARLAEYQCRCSQSLDYTNFGYTRIANLPEESHFATFDFTTSAKLVRAMEKNARAVRTLRNFYSQRRKDRASQTNALSLEETLRFDKAIYRYWLWLEMVQLGAVWKETEDDGNEEDEDDEDHEEYVEVLCDEFVNIVRSLSSEELFEMLHINEFLEETRRWGGERGHGHLHYGSTDPAVLASNLEYWSIDDLYHYRSWDPIRDHINDELLSRKVKPEQLSEKTSSAVVTIVVGAQDKCSRCQNVGGLGLLGTPNMFLLSGLLPVRERISLPPGVLHRNRDECGLIYLHLLDTEHPIPEKDIFHEMVDLDIDPADFDTFPDEHWSKDGWYCLGCIKTLYRQRFLPWWRKTKQGDNASTQEDCWYGYNCRTMTHRAAHAQKLNHLCKPTRGDAPVPTPPPQPINNPTANDPN